MSMLAWIDFDQADRDRTRRIMDLFQSEDSRDELGLGSVRDVLADLLFPGTSTIQTRLRYMLFVPWIYREAGRQPGHPATRRDYANALEVRLIDALVRGGETRGVIGSAARERLKRLPSDVYWAGLLTLGIRRVHGSRSACLEASPSDAEALWSAGLPQPPKGFLESSHSAAQFKLTAEEAEFLRDRLTHEAPRSLLTLLSRKGNTPDCEMIWQHPDRAQWPDEIKSLVDHAERFSTLMHGAALLYNLMLAERAASMQGSETSTWHEKAEDYSNRIQAWTDGISPTNFADWNLTDLWDVSGRTSHTVTEQTRRFIEAWREVVMRTDAQILADKEAQALVRDREIRLKGAKSRFRNDGALMRWGGASGTKPLNFRWQPVVSDHLKDLVDAG